MKRWNLLDFFLVLLVVLAGCAFYFSFIQPIRFSHLIKREGVMRYAEIEFLLPEDLSWIQGTIPAGEESRNVYGELDWKILGFREKVWGGKKLIQVRAKLLIAEESSGVLRYGKYTLVKGAKIYLINDHYFLEGRIVDFHLLEEQIHL